MTNSSEPWYTVKNTVHGGEIAMKRLSRKKLLAISAGVAILLLLLLLLLFSCDSEQARTEQLYPSEGITGEAGNATASLITKPEGYPDEVGSALAMMMFLHKEDESYLYHVAFRDSKAGDASTRESIAGRLEDANALHQKEWTEIAENSQGRGWFYFLFTADEVWTLAGAGIECRFVGTGEGLSEDESGSLSWEQAVEHICQWAGDSFRARPGEQ